MYRKLMLIGFLFLIGFSFISAETTLNPGSEVTWRINKTGAEESLDVRYEILNKTATKFYVSHFDKQSYENSLESSLKDINKVPVEETSSSWIMEFLFDGDLKMKDSLDLDKEEECFIVTYKELKEGISFKIGWDSVTVESSAYGTSFYTQNGRSLVWTSETTGYFFYTESDNDFVYKKTTDSGATWGSAVMVESYSAYKFAIWYDKWTNQDSGTKIHIAWTDGWDHDIKYRTLDTSDDTLSSEVVVFNGASSEGPTWLLGCLSLVKARGGNLYAGGWIDNDGEHGFYRSTDSGVNWASRTDLCEANAVDLIIFEPGAETDSNDIWAFYWDASANAISLKVYDNSGNSWSETSISGNVYETSTYFQMDSVTRHSDNHSILAIWNKYDDATSDLMIWDVGGSGSITAKTDVVTNHDDCVQVGFLINQQTDDLYVSYLGKSDGTESFPGFVNSYYKNSTDGGSNWGSGTLLSLVKDDHRVITGGTSVGDDGGRFQPIWFNDDLNDWITNTTTGVGISASGGANDTCTCAGLNTNWEIDMSDYCNITSDCDLGTGYLNFTGSGVTRCNAEINTTNLGDPGANGILRIKSSCEINVN